MPGGMPTRWAERWGRFLPFCLVLLSVSVPCLFAISIFPQSAADGVGHVSGSHTPFWLVTGGLTVAGLVIAFSGLRADHELLFGCLTIFAALVAVAMFVSVFVRRQVGNESAWTFLAMAALSVAALSLIAHDWARRQLLIATAVAATALGLFIIRVGYESLNVPPQREREQIAARAEAVESTLEAQHTRAEPGLLEAARTAATALGQILGRTSPPNVDLEIRAQANLLLHEANERLAKRTRALTQIPQSDFLTFDALVASEPVSYPAAATTELADAVHALRGAAAAAAAQLDHSALDQAICVVKACPGSSDEITSNSNWVDAKHELDVELASYRAAVTTTAANQAALKAVLARQPQVNEDISVLSAIGQGPAAMWRSVSHGTGPALVPGPLGWVVFGAALLGLLGSWLKINARQLAGPVDVLSVNSGSDSDNSGSDRDKELTTVLRVAVLKNVPEPGASPGSPSVKPVTNLLDIAGVPLTAVGKAVQAVLTLLGRRYGYQVSVDAVAGGPAESDRAPGAASPAVPDPVSPMPKRTTALVRIKSLSGGATVASHAFPCRSDTDAVQAAGLWAAGYILDRSSRIPSWAAWSAETAHALATAVSEDVITMDVIEAALKDAPNSGILLVLLGHRYELAGRRSDAINCYARAVAMHPRYPVARYRLAVAVADLLDKPQWSEDQLDDLRALGPAIVAMNVNVNCPLSALAGKFSLEAWWGRTDFGKLAVTLLKRLEDDLRYRHRLVDAVRRSERDYAWAGLAWNFRTDASRFRQVVMSARMALDDDLPRLDKKAAKPDSWWQISYNAACGYAVKGKELDKLRALALLEQAMIRPNAYQLSAAWARKDPDLRNVRECARFRQFLEQLGSGDKESLDDDARWI